MASPTTETMLYCPRCRAIHVIHRKTSKQKKAGHYKNYYCFKCKSTHNHIELRDLIFEQEVLDQMVEEMKAQGKY